MALLEATERMMVVDPVWSEENYRRLCEDDPE